MAERCRGCPILPGAFQIDAVGEIAWCLKHEEMKTRKQLVFCLASPAFRIRQQHPDWGQGQHQNESHSYPGSTEDLQGINRRSTENALNDGVCVGESEPLIVVTAEYAAEILPRIRNAPILPHRFPSKHSCARLRASVDDVVDRPRPL